MIEIYIKFRSNNSRNKDISDSTGIRLVSYERLHIFFSFAFPVFALISLSRDRWRIGLSSTDLSSHASTATESIENSSSFNSHAMPSSTWKLGEGRRRRGRRGRRSIRCEKLVESSRKSVVVQASRWIRSGEEKKKIGKKRKVISRDRYIQFECVCAEVSKKKKHYQAKRGG